jgi:hypothetical protein
VEEAADDKEEEIIRQFGLHPAEQDLGEIRAIIREQAALRMDAHTLLMKICCVLLFNAGHVTDSLLIWQAKQSGFDAACSIDGELLCGAGLAETMLYMGWEASRDPEATKALAYIRSCAEPGGTLDGFAPEVQSAWYDRYYRESS